MDAWRAGTADCAAREARAGEISKTQRHITGRAQKRDRSRVCSKRYRHILHIKADEKDPCERLERVSSGQEHKVESSRLKSRVVCLYYLEEPSFTEMLQRLALVSDRFKRDASALNTILSYLRKRGAMFDRATVRSSGCMCVCM